VAPLNRPRIASGEALDSSASPSSWQRPSTTSSALWKFRWYSVIDQALIWLTVALVFGALLERFLGVPPRRDEPDEESAPVPAASGQP
jgi:hypothetical protein